MSAHNVQNGRQPSFPPVQSVAPFDFRIRNLNTTDQIKVCRDYVWGICNKYNLCKFRHECSVEEMTSIIRFCHDHQNRTGCLRPDCTYLHTSSEEENLFLSTGKLPRVLLERHAAMNAAAAAVASGGTVSVDNAAPVFMAQPPPPPPPPLSVTAPPPPPPPQPVPTVMPPPPPPPPPTESSTLHAAPPTPLYTVPPPQPPPDFQLNQLPPTVPPIFNRPPPPIPKHINGPVKRNMANDCEAGPSKHRKPDDAKVAESVCEMCIQRELSITLCAEELEKMRTQREYKKLLYKTKKDDSENLKAMMRLLLPADICLAIEEFIDGVQSPPSLSLSVPQLMSRLLEDRTDYSNNMMDSIQSSSMRELFIGYLLNSSSSSERPPSELRPSEVLSADVIRSSTASIISNGYSRLVSGQRVAVSATTAAPAPPAPAPAPAPARPAYAPPYPPPYQPAVPPPAVRPAYPPFALPGAFRDPELDASRARWSEAQATALAAGAAAEPFPSASRPPAPAPPALGPASAAPVPPAPAPLNGLGYGPYMPHQLGGYSSPHTSHYYPPFQ